MTDGFGQDALIQIVVNLMFLGLSWWALQSFRFDLFVREPKADPKQSCSDYLQP